MSENLPEKPASNSEILFYQTEDGQSRIQVRLEEGTIWLSQAQMAELFQASKQNVSLHIQRIFKDGELSPESTVKYYLTVQNEGERQVNRRIAFYNLDVVLAVGYRVRSHRGTQFRQWATERLREYLVKGFTMDDERLKEGRSIGADYFDELLERIRDIRASEKRFYQKVLDIYKLAADYDPKSEAAVEFFKVVQNKLHWAITGHTAAEIIRERADSTKPNMGLTSFKGVKVRKADVTIAKNYLNEDEIRQLNRFVTMFLDYAETQAEKRVPLYMRDWRDKLDGFLSFNEKDILRNAGKVKMEVAQSLALKQYEEFSQRRLKEEANTPDVDFERAVKGIEAKTKPGKRKAKDAD